MPLPRVVRRMDRDAAIVADYQQLGSAEKAAKRNGVSKKAALRVLKRAGVERRKRGQEKAERLRRFRPLTPQPPPAASPAPPPHHRSPAPELTRCHHSQQAFRHLAARQKSLSGGYPPPAPHSTITPR